MSTFRDGGNAGLRNHGFRGFAACILITTEASITELLMRFEFGMASKHGAVLPPLALVLDTYPVSFLYSVLLFLDSPRDKPRIVIQKSAVRRATQAAYELATFVREGVQPVFTRVPPIALEAFT